MSEIVGEWYLNNERRTDLDVMKRSMYMSMQHAAFAKQLV